MFKIDHLSSNRNAHSTYEKIESYRRRKREDQTLNEVFCESNFVENITTGHNISSECGLGEQSVLIYNVISSFDVIIN